MNRSGATHNTAVMFQVPEYIPSNGPNYSHIGPHQHNDSWANKISLLLTVRDCCTESGWTTKAKTGPDDSMQQQQQGKWHNNIGYVRHMVYHPHSQVITCKTRKMTGSYKLCNVYANWWGSTTLSHNSSWTWHTVLQPCAGSEVVK